MDFARIPALVERDGGGHELFVGSIEVLTGDFVAFRGTDPAFGVDAVVASGTLPEIARATVIGSGRYAGVYWDGLYSQRIRRSASCSTRAPGWPIPTRSG